jgi:hypothetical protein
MNGSGFSKRKVGWFPRLVGGVFGLVVGAGLIVCTAFILGALWAFVVTGFQTTCDWLGC